MNTKEIDAIYNDCYAHSVLKHPLLIEIGSGTVATKNMAHIIRAYVAYSMEFPGIIEHIINFWTWDTSTDFLLKRLLREENDMKGETHAQQLANCADSLGIPYDKIFLDKLELPCKNYANQIGNMVRKGKDFALGMIGPGTENIVPMLYTPYLTWLQRFAPNADHTFFREHAVIDISHSELLRKCIDKEVTDIQEFAAGADFALTQRSMMYDSLHDVLRKLNF